MAKQDRLCQMCTKLPFKYTCPQCYITYCSLDCYKSHKGSCPEKTTDRSPERSTGHHVDSEDSHTPSKNSVLVDASTEESKSLPDQVPMRPLTSLQWPYVPDESAFPDPLKRDDPKPLPLAQYEAIASSPEIRRILASHEHLPALLTSLDKLRGEERESALEKALGVTPADLNNQFEIGGTKREIGEDVLAFRKLAEAVETAVRGGKERLGLDWGD